VQGIIKGAQTFLTQSGIGINDVRNGFPALPGHFWTHTNKFFMYVGRTMPNCPGQKTAEQWLALLEALAKGGKFRP